MAKRRVTKSKKQYVQSVNTGAMDVVRNLEDSKQACDMELEGVVSKRKSAKYHSGRNEAWVKVTCRHRETFVIAGLAFKGSKFDGVYLGGEEKGKLAYAGKVEHGFSEQQVADLKKRAEELTVKKPASCCRTCAPFPKRTGSNRCYWVMSSFAGRLRPASCGTRRIRACGRISWNCRKHPGVLPHLSEEAMAGQNKENVKTGQQGTNELWKRPGSSSQSPSQPAPHPRPREPKDNETA
jgi:ATP dependent DNA ligase C terminal region